MVNKILVYRLVNGETLIAKTGQADVDVYEDYYGSYEEWKMYSLPSSYETLFHPRIIIRNSNGVRTVEIPFNDKEFIFINNSNIMYRMVPNKELTEQYIKSLKQNTVPQKNGEIDLHSNIETEITIKKTQ